MPDLELSVSIHPYIHSPLSRSAIYFNRSLALLPMMLLAVYNYGLIAFFTMLVAVVAVLLPTYLILRSRGRRLADVEYENYYYAFLFALILPAGAPLHAVAAGGIALNLLVFSDPSGATGIFRILNPVAAVSCLMTMAFSGRMSFFIEPRAFMSAKWFSVFPDEEYYNGFLSGIKGSASMFDGWEKAGFTKLIFGWHPGHFAEVSAILIMAAAAFLAVRKSLDMAPFWGAVTGLVASTALFSWQKGMLAIMGEAVYFALGSIFLFYSLFMLADYYSSPERFASRVAFGFIFGAMAPIFYRVALPGTDPCNFALLAACLAIPALDSATSRGNRSVI